MKNLWLSGIAITAVMLVTTSSNAGPNDSVWTPIFNHQNLTDWHPKFFGDANDVNQNNTFQVNNGMLDVIINKPWSTSNNRSTFGHLFYLKQQFSYYMIRTKYRYLADTTAFLSQGDWTIQNNGLMLHATWPMSVDAQFPNSIELQLLGGKSKTNDGSTAGICAGTAGTTAYLLDGKTSISCAAAKRHSLAYSEPLGPTKWIYVMGKILADSIGFNYVRSRPDTAWDSVFGYMKMSKKVGYITIQAEGSSAEFADIEIMNLVGCKNPSSPNYKAYFVKDSAAACNVVAVRPGVAPESEGWAYNPSQRRLFVNLDEKFTLRITDLTGKTWLEKQGRGQESYSLESIRPRGLYILSISRTGKVFSQKMLLGGSSL